MTHKRLVIDVASGNQYEEDLTTQEVADLEAGFAIAEAQKEEAELKKIARKELLVKLGITEEEAKLLLS